MVNNCLVGTLGVIELSSIAKGMLVCDQMLKKAEVRILRALPIGCGKYLIVLTADEASLFEAIKIGQEIATPNLVEHLYITQIDPQVIEALAGKRVVPHLNSLGIVESSSLASAIKCADIAVKAAEVNIIELTFDLDLGGKAFFTVTGELRDIEAALEAAVNQMKKDGAFVNKEIIARPHSDLSNIVLKH